MSIEIKSLSGVVLVTLSCDSLVRTDLRYANLTNADLRYVNLRGANLTGANLTNADLTGANLTNADLTGADLRNAPVVEHLHSKMILAIETEPNLFDMESWHCTTSCGTSHCRAGWAVHLAGKAGYELEEQIGTAAAGALITLASCPSKVVPDFYCDNEMALADIRARAKEENVG